MHISVAFASASQVPLCLICSNRYTITTDMRILVMFDMFGVSQWENLHLSIDMTNDK